MDFSLCSTRVLLRCAWHQEGLLRLWDQRSLLNRLTREMKTSRWRNKLEHPLCSLRFRVHKGTIGVFNLAELYQLVEISVFWDVAPYSPIEVNRRFRGAYCLHYRPDDGVSTRFWNVGLLRRDYRSLYPRRLSSSYSRPWEPEISLSEICQT
jgi:hypothetical protein